MQNQYKIKEITKDGAYFISNLTFNYKQAKYIKNILEYRCKTDYKIELVKINKKKD